MVLGLSWGGGRRVRPVPALPALDTARRQHGCLDRGCGDVAGRSRRSTATTPRGKPRAGPRRAGPARARRRVARHIVRSRRGPHARGTRGMVRRAGSDAPVDSSAASVRRQSRPNTAFRLRGCLAGGCRLGRDLTGPRRRGCAPTGRSRAPDSAFTIRPEFRVQLRRNAQ